MKKIIIANLKMNKTPSEVKNYLIELLPQLSNNENDVVICPPFVCLQKASELVEGNKSISLGAQNIAWEKSGAYTGETSADMLKSLGVNTVLVGHSERRKIFLEDNVVVNKKVKFALQNNMRVVLCIGETQTEKDLGKGNAVLKVQIEKGLAGLYENELKNVVIAYEPVWAIGTGVSATDKQIEESIKEVRKIVSSTFSAVASRQVPVLYGGSVNLANSKKILSTNGVDGILVGSACLDANTFAKMATNK